MKAPRFTDTHRFPRPYVQSTATDITKAIRAEQKRLADMAKTKPKTNIRDLSDVFKGAVKK